MAAHFAQEHRCCWIVELEQCGLWCGHDGDHLGYVPGGYLPPPLIGPLDVLRVSGRFRVRRCPVCGRTPKHWWEFDASVESPVSAYRRSGEDWQMTLESLWSFSPCGCEAREILEEQR